MSDYRLIQLQTLSRDEDLPFNVPHGRPQPGSGSSPQSVPQVPLQEMKQHLGILYAPTYLPDGFELLESMVRGGTSLLCYQGSDNRRGDRLRITQFSAAGHPMVRAGFEERVRINGFPGYVINGGWMVRGTTGNLKARWETGYTQELLFERETLWWSLRLTRAIPTSVSSERELTMIAGSMRAI